jgi:hypothetical protein
MHPETHHVHGTQIFVVIYVRRKYKFGVCRWMPRPGVLGDGRTIS